MKKFKEFIEECEQLEEEGIAMTTGSASPHGVGTPNPVEETVIVKKKPPILKRIKTGK